MMIIPKTATLQKKEAAVRLALRKHAWICVEYRGDLFANNRGSELQERISGRIERMQRRRGTRGYRVTFDLEEEGFMWTRDKRFWNERSRQSWQVNSRSVIHIFETEEELRAFNLAVML